MSTHFLHAAGAAALALATAAAPLNAAAAAEQVVGGIEAVLFVCTPIDA